MAHTMVSTTTIAQRDVWAVGGCLVGGQARRRAVSENALPGPVPIGCDACDPAAAVPVVRGKRLETGPPQRLCRAHRPGARSPRVVRGAAGVGVGALAPARRSSSRVSWRSPAAVPVCLSSCLDCPHLRFSIECILQTQSLCIL